MVSRIGQLPNYRLQIMTLQAIEAQGLRKEFGEKVAVSDLTLSVG
jgi:hypothetical protein